MRIIQHLIILLSYKTIAKCELYLLHLEKSIPSSLYHGIKTTYKHQLTNQRTSIRTIILELYNYTTVYNYVVNISLYFSEPMVVQAY